MRCSRPDGVIERRRPNHALQRPAITARSVLAMGDGENDIGMLRAAGLSVAFQPKSERVRRAAKHVVTERLDEILGLVR